MGLSPQEFKGVASHTGTLRIWASHANRWHTICKGRDEEAQVVIWGHERDRKVPSDTEDLEYLRRGKQNPELRCSNVGCIQRYHQTGDHGRVYDEIHHGSPPARRVQGIQRS